MRAERRVLVVDDEPLVTKSCRRALTAAGYHVDTSESGCEGMDRALAEHFDLVVTDLRMPDLDGMDLVRQLRHQRPGTAIVIITGYGTVPSAVEATKAGVSDYVEKPFTPDQIAHAADRALGPAPNGPTYEVDADLVRDVLGRLAHDDELGTAVLAEGSCMLSGYALSDTAKAAIASGDIAWIEKACGPLSAEERAWLKRRLEAETW